MNYEFDNNKPIYKQLVDLIKLAIITEKYKPSEKIPSVREFSLMYKINPNTVNRALLELEEQKLIITKRTSGKYVTENETVIKKSKQELAQEKINKFLHDMKELNIEETELQKMIFNRELGE